MKSIRVITANLLFLTYFTKSYQSNKQGPITQGPITQGPITQGPITQGPDLVIQTSVKSKYQANKDSDLSQRTGGRGKNKKKKTKSPIKKVPIAQGQIKKVPITQGPIKKVPITKGPIKKAPITQGPITEGPTIQDITETPLNPFVYATADFGYSIKPFVMGPEDHMEFDNREQKVFLDKGKYHSEKTIFTENLVRLNKFNNISKTAYFGINELATLPYAYFIEYYTGFDKNKPDEKGVDYKYKPIRLPKYFDWMEHGAVTPVRNQLNCSNSYVYSALGAIEGQYAAYVHITADDVPVGKKITAPLSAQHIFNCMEGVHCLSKRKPHDVFESLIEKGGCISDTDGPQEDYGRKNYCVYQESQIILKVTGYTKLNIPDEEALRYALLEYGPLSVAIFVSQMVKNYGQGVLMPSDCRGKPNHAVLLTGYGIDRGVPYWLIKNSWGRQWGENGFMRLVRGKNACNVTRYVAVPQASRVEPKNETQNATESAESLDTDGTANKTVETKETSNNESLDDNNNKTTTKGLNEDEETVATIRNESEETVATIRNESEETVATIRNESEETVATIRMESEETVATIKNENEETENEDTESNNVLRTLRSKTRKAKANKGVTNTPKTDRVRFTKRSYYLQPHRSKDVTNTHKTRKRKFTRKSYYLGSLI